MPAGAARAGRRRGSFRVLFNTTIGASTTRYHVRTAADAEDVTQDAFVRAYRALGSLREGQAFLSWLYRIALNSAPCATGARPTESLDGQVVWGEETLERQIADPGARPAQAPRSTRRAVVRAATRSSPGPSEVVVLHHLQGCPSRDRPRCWLLGGHGQIAPGTGAGRTEAEAEEHVLAEP